MMAKTKMMTPCPHCNSTKGRTLLGEDRKTLEFGKVHQTVVTMRRFRCYGCGKSYNEESDV